ncbi:MAG: hydantoinase/oxoprolinase family protein [Gammaproteobacteria bacterium]|nr:MAG: hydantoinase/oxoprolinase family protein [Gammaproteobacteria bacterium]
MRFNIGIDVGGTFTDFLVTSDQDDPKIFKVLSTPKDPSIGLINGLTDIAEFYQLSLKELSASIDTIVHGTTVTTNATLTLQGAKTGLLTTNGVKDALEMRRGIREEQYNNRFTNVPPLVPRYLRKGVRGRLNYCGDEIEALNVEDIKQQIEFFKTEGVEALAICFMNSFANQTHEDQAAELVKEQFPEAYLTVSSELLPSIRFYDRISSTVLNSYVGPKLKSYLDQLTQRLKDIEFEGVLLIMQSNGGVMSPETALSSPALTLLSGPAAAPKAGLQYVRAHDKNDCITVDMGGTSFDAALVKDGLAVVNNQGEINRYRISLPMLDIVTIGSGGGSIGWIDEGGLLRMGPQSAGADPGPACYNKGGTHPACTDADLVLGYLDPEFFAGGKIALNKEASIKAIEEHVAKPLGMSVREAAVGMYRIINNDMAQGVREISIKRGRDPREFPMVVAGGAGPIHACMICNELDVPMFIVPRESSIFCAAGMLMSDLEHDFVHSFVSPMEEVDWQQLLTLVESMQAEGDKLLTTERIDQENRRYILNLDCRYLKQFHEVSFPVDVDIIKQKDTAKLAAIFHQQHLDMYGYSLEEEGSLIELINVRMKCVGITAKPSYKEEAKAPADPSFALKSNREAYVPEAGEFQVIPVYDGDKTLHGNEIDGPAIIEQVNTTIFLSANYKCECDKHGSFVITVKEAGE